MNFVANIFNYVPIYPQIQHPKARPSINREVSNEFRPSPWITDVIPRKSPFVPQMGDEVCICDVLGEVFYISLVMYFTCQVVCRIGQIGNC